jgi:hypothetical protein
MQNKKYSIPFFIGYLLIIAGAVCVLAKVDILFLRHQIGFYIFCAGAVLNSIFRYLLLPHSDNKKVRRLNTQQLFIVLLLLAAGYMMFKNTASWVIPLLICAVIDLWLSFRYS